MPLACECNRKEIAHARIADRCWLRLPRRISALSIAAFVHLVFYCQRERMRRGRDDGMSASKLFFEGWTNTAGAASPVFAYTSEVVVAYTVKCPSLQSLFPRYSQSYFLSQNEQTAQGEYSRQNWVQNWEPLWGVKTRDGRVKNRNLCFASMQQSWKARLLKRGETRTLRGGSTFVNASEIDGKRLAYFSRKLLHEEKNSIKINVLSQYFCSTFIFSYILYCRIVKNNILGRKFYYSLRKSYRAVR